MKEAPLLASDGLLARRNGAYAKAKLEWMEAYLEAGLAVASGKMDRVYVDLFAGPGMSVDPETGEEFASGALRAVQLTGRGSAGSTFTDAYLVNLNPNDHGALEQRIERLMHQGKLRIPRHRIRIVHADANDYVHDILAAVHQRAWMFVFADIEAPSNMPFATVRALKSRGHQSVDLYALFPLQMGLQRALPYDLEKGAKAGRGLDEYFGVETWRTVYHGRVTEAYGDEFRRKLEEIYCEQLQQLWTQAGCVTKISVEGTNKTLYHMLFAASNPAALRVAQGVTSKTMRDAARGQMGLGL